MDNNFQKNTLENFAGELANAVGLSEEDKNKLLSKFIGLTKDTKINILITGPTGCGKSSTINALFGDNTAKVGQGADPETMNIQSYQLNNIVLWDSPGLGDGKEADTRHAKNIIDKLYEKDSNGDALIDLVLVIVNGMSRDLGTTYELINKVIIPNLGENTDRLIVAINKCDMAKSGRGWDFEKNEPKPELINFLDEQINSISRRIKETTDANVKPIYYSAGYKDGDEEQKPYNLSKLLMFIIKNTKSEKRAVYINDTNKDKTVWEKDDGLEDYTNKVQKTLWDAIKEVAVSAVPAIAKGLASVASSVVDGIAKGLGSFASSVGSFFSRLF